MPKISIMLCPNSALLSMEIVLFSCDCNWKKIRSSLLIQTKYIWKWKWVVHESSIEDDWGNGRVHRAISILFLKIKQLGRSLYAFISNLYDIQAPCVAVSQGRIIMVQTWTLDSACLIWFHLMFQKQGLYFDK